ncbi:hypothetical protein D3C80_1906840 [compost metagenome]
MTVGQERFTPVFQRVHNKGSRHMILLFHLLSIFRVIWGCFYVILRHSFSSLCLRLIKSKRHSCLIHLTHSPCPNYIDKLYVGAEGVMLEVTDHDKKPPGEP